MRVIFIFVGINKFFYWEDLFILLIFKDVIMINSLILKFYFLFIRFIVRLFIYWLKSFIVIILIEGEIEVFYLLARHLRLYCWLVGGLFFLCWHLCLLFDPLPLLRTLSCISLGLLFRWLIGLEFLRHGNDKMNFYHKFFELVY
jgi:hypothetical protein